RQPQFSLVRVLKTFRRNTNDRISASVEHQVFSHYISLTAKLSLPEVVANNDDWSVPGVFICRDKETAELWSNSENVEEVCRGRRHVQTERAISEGEVNRVVSDGRKMFKDGVLLSPVEKVRRSYLHSRSLWIELLNCDDTACFSI